MKIFKSHPLMSFLKGYLVDSPQPSNITCSWNFGSLLGFCLVLQIVIGVRFAMHYNSSILQAYNLLDYIIKDLNGYLVYYLNANTASAFFFIIYFCWKLDFIQNSKNFFSFILFWFKLGLNYLHLYFFLYYISLGICGRIFLYMVLCILYIYIRSNYIDILYCTDSLSEAERIEWWAQEVRIKDLSRRNSIPNLPEANSEVIYRRYSCPDLVSTLDTGSGWPYSDSDRHPETKPLTEGSRDLIQRNRAESREFFEQRSARFNRASYRMDYLTWQEEVMHKTKLRNRTFRMIGECTEWIEANKNNTEIKQKYWDSANNRLPRLEDLYKRKCADLEKLIIDGRTQDPERVNNSIDTRVPIVRFQRDYMTFNEINSRSLR